MRAAALSLALVCLCLPAAATAKVRAPDGDYTGPRQLFMRASGDQIDLIAFNFPCKGKHAHGRTSIDSIPLKKRDQGYKFSFKGRGSVTYSDGKPDQNGFFSISGQFTRKAKSASGRFQASTPRCPRTDKLDWSATRSAAQRR